MVFPSHEGSANPPSFRVQEGPPEQSVQPPLPTLPSNAQLDIEALRDPWERRYFRLMYVIGLLVVVLVVWVLGRMAFAQDQGMPTTGAERSGDPDFLSLLPLMFMFGLYLWINWFFWKLALWRVQGDGIEVGPTQYPQVYRVIKEGSDRLGLSIVPRTIIVQGHGNFHLTVEKRLARRGLIVITSNVMDVFTKRPSSRELMMLVGQQIGHIKAGHYRFWFLKHVIGKLTLFLYNAWWRRCQFTADKVGLLLVGEYAAAERAMCITAVGAGLAPGTNTEELAQQRARLLESRWAWYALFFSSYPYVIDRILRLREFAQDVAGEAGSGRLGVIPLHHVPLRSQPVLIIHGHDKVARLELENFLFAKLPYVTPRVMVAEASAALSIP